MKSEKGGHLKECMNRALRRHDFPSDVINKFDILSLEEGCSEQRQSAYIDQGERKKKALRPRKNSVHRRRRSRLDCNPSRRRRFC